MPFKDLEKKREAARRSYHKNKHKHKEKDKQRQREWRKNNPDKMRETLRNYKNKLRRENPKYRLECNISRSLRQTLKFAGSNKNNVEWESLVGYTKQQLVEHLEKMFDDKMNWDNYGSYWHIDHIKPKSWFKYSSTEEEAFKLCWALENLQPLEASENKSKGNRREG